MRRILLLSLLLAVALQPGGFAAGGSAAGGRALVTVERPDAGTAARLLDAGVAVLRDQGGYLVALASPGDLDAIRAMGLRVTIIDPDPSGKDFYIAPADAVVPGENAGAAGDDYRLLAPSRYGAIIEATPEAADRLAARGAHIAKVFMTPMRAAVIDKPAPRAAPASADPLIQAMVDSVSGPGIDASIQRMQDFGNRYALGDSVNSARDWIVARFHSFGIDSVALQEFDARFGETVIATLPGVGHPDKHIIIGGHYDSTSRDFLNAPGADDNASGTTCVLECARVLAQYQYDYTIKFIAFCGEEQGLVGSEHYAAEAAADSEDVVAMINVDMIGYVAAGDALDLDLVSNESSQWLKNVLLAARTLYVPELSVINGALPNGANSDHASFWRHGFDAIMFWEDTNHWSPYIHTVNDLVGLSYNSPTLAHRCIKLAVATVATLAEPFRVVIQHTPDVDATDTQSAYHVAANILTNQALDSDSLLVVYTVRDPDAAPGVVTEHTAPLVYLGAGDAYEALIPPLDAGTVVDYYLMAATAEGYVEVDPRGAPATRYRFIVGEPTVVFADDFEEDRGWTVGAPDDNATDGIWVREAPNLTRISVTIVQPGWDHTPDPDSVCFVTTNAPPGVIDMGYKDIDNGKTTLFSPVFDLSGYGNVWFSYWRWYTNDTGGVPDDVWIVDVSSDGGQTWANIETLPRSERAWNRVGGNLADYAPLTSTVQFRFVAADNDPASVVEALVDDFELISYTGDSTHAGNTPPGVVLDQNYPNPFNPHTTIGVHVSPPARASLRVYDVAGRLVATLLDHDLVSGDRVITWDGTTHTGTHAASGVYFYRLTTPKATLTRKMVVVR